ncbi:hypothetical protein [Streptosporangium pseudovulgare]|uniref:Uncharacterized protein n=1 Tax=Streptosporangium pseudovulgare TaxID=35765 RepID=A0ABQ2RLJ9_9ACTN|nr:hypothetical protein [Streptosporangium pseudovulgare]GGQ34327.1 hypothetical protein GCM10010140_75400 [Streptosporangium pseudovulgare]
MIRRLLVTSACVGLAVLAPAVAASASTAKTANCCGAGAFIPTSTVTYGQVVTPVAVASSANCLGYSGVALAGGNCFGYGAGCYGGGFYGGGGYYGGGLVPGGYGLGGGGFLGGGNNVNTLSPGTGVVGNGTGIGGLIGVGNLGIGVL